MSGAAARTGEFKGKKKESLENIQEITGGEKPESHNN